MGGIGWPGAGRGALAAGLALVVSAAGPQAPPPPRYAPGPLRCAAFLEDVQTRVDARRGGDAWQERGRRAGRLQVRARPDGTAIVFEAWYDSLDVAYDARSGALRPDTDGLVGGRWEGRMTPTGVVLLEVRPFMPADLKSVSDLSDVLLDFFPPLPGTALAVNATWSDTAGLTVDRLRDSAAAGERLARYHWRLVGGSTAPPVPLEGTVRLEQTTTDEGILVWSPGRGPVAWRREIVVDAQVRAARGAARSRVTQVVTVRRVTDDPGCQ